MAEGFFDFTSGAVLTSAQVDDYLMSQTVMRFASAAARNAALVEVEGQIAYLKDSNTLTVFDGTSWWTVGSATKSVTTGTQFVSQGATPTFTDTLTEYKIENGICEWWFKMAITSAGTAGTAFYLNLPVTADNDSRVIGEGWVLDASAVTMDTGVWDIVPSFPGRIQFLCSRSTGSGWGATPNIALASGDIISGHVRFPVDAAP